MTESFVIVGCGVFGLTTALELSTRQSTCQITLLDRYEPPVPDGASVDSSRIVRADYSDAVYASLARRARDEWLSDPDLQKAYHECGMLLNTADDKVDKGYLDAAIANVKALGIQVEEYEGDQVLQRITGGQLPQDSQGQKLRGYLNPVSGFADSRVGVEILYARAKARHNITFIFEPIEALLYAAIPPADPSSPHASVTGVRTDAGTQVHAKTTILAMGAWQLPELPIPCMATGQVIGYIPLSNEESQRYAEMPITINFSTGWFCIPPYKGHLKVARHAEGYLNTQSVRDKHGKHERLLSVPRTALTHGVREIPREGESALREGLHLYLPELADRPFSHSRLCWYTDTPTSDFIIDWHPEIKNLFIATGGSGHGFKFLPILGDLIVSVINGTAESLLKKKWSFANAREAYEHGIRGDGSRGKGARLEWDEL